MKDIERGSAKVSDLKDAPYNPRKIAPENLEALGASMDRFGLVLTGGETASICLRRLRAVGVEIVAEVQAGVAGGIVCGGDRDGMAVVTKAGAFGTEDTLLAAINWLRPPSV